MRKWLITQMNLITTDLYGNAPDTKHCYTCIIISPKRWLYGNDQETIHVNMVITPMNNRGCCGNDPEVTYG